MGRRRLHIDAKEPLPAGLNKHRRQYRARRPGEAWTYFGTEYLAALAAFQSWSQIVGGARTIAWLMDVFVGEVCPSRVKAKTLAPRTARDYLRDSAVIKKGLGKIPLAALGVAHICKFRDARAEAAPSHVRNELACLTSALAYAVEAELVPRNVAKDVERPSRTIRERLITDAEYLSVFAKATSYVRLAMVLGVRTLGLPADVLKMGPRNVRRYDNGMQTLAFRRGKTNEPVEVEIVGELATALEPLLNPPTLHPTFVRREDGKPYTVDGIGAMFRRYCLKQA